MIGLLELRR